LALAFSSDASAQPAEACRACHAQIVASFQKTGMGRSISLQPALPQQSFYHRKSNRYYQVQDRTIRRHQVNASGVKVNFIERSAEFAIGSGNHATTYIHRTPQGKLFELPLSFYAFRKSRDVSRLRSARP
jgi:hypothetical protein